MKKFSFLTLLGVLILILAACTDDSNVEEEASEGEESAAAEGGTLTLAIPSDAASMDPHGSNDVPSEQIRDTIYEPLVTQDENFEIVPVRQKSMNKLTIQHGSSNYVKVLLSTMAVSLMQKWLKRMLSA